MGARMLFTGGLVRTGDPHAPVSDAVAVIDGVVAALGKDARRCATQAPRSSISPAALSCHRSGTVMPIHCWVGSR